MIKKRERGNAPQFEGTNMNQPYAAPQAELERSDVVLEKPKRIAVDLTFWAAHLGIIVGLFLPLGVDPVIMPTVDFAAFSIGLIAGIGYFIAIGLYASGLGRSGILWGGLAFLFSPLGVWITYIMSFVSEPKPR
ncbi:MAG: hypothetical protein AAFN07_17355 [Pseudomonadota bacterium]